ncbi:hypothetical protein [Actinopolymorpha sp. B17G11]|uniref:hypothetical protein n=1 Tax=Actinopolymorpha sp. B17G11 TaxID=3160861 RepID=UPI0032E4F35C
MSRSTPRPATKVARRLRRPLIRRGVRKPLLGIIAGLAALTARSGQRWPTPAGTR